MRTDRRSRLPLLVSLALLVAILAAAGAGVAVLANWVRGEECRALLESRASEALGGKAEFGPLEWLWVGVASPRVKTVTVEGARPRTLEAGNVRARLRLSSLLQGFWAVEEIAMEKTRVHFGAALPGENASAKDAAPSPIPHSLFRLPSWIPSVLVVEVVRSGDTDLLFDLPEGKMLELLGTRLELFPEKEEARLEAHGGKMIWTRFPGFRPDLLWARGRLREGRLRLNGAELAFSEGGTADLDGEFPGQDGVSRIAGHCKGVPIGRFFPAAANSLGGTLSGEGRASWTPEALLTMEGTVSVDNATVHGVPALDELASFTGMGQFRNLTLSKASAGFSRNVTVTRWRDIVLEAPGLLKVTGQAEVGDDGSLSGTFQAGVTTDIVRVIPMAKELLAAEERDGYFWMPVHVGGTLEHPTEDLRPRLVTAIAAKASGVIREGLDVGLRMLGVGPGSPVVKDATNAVKTLEKDAGSVIDAVGGFLK